MSKQELKQKGFTIIEVVLVLAIAALIFLMVFIALPALQRSQRDTARKQDVSTVAAAVNDWQGNNRNSTGWPSTTELEAYATEISNNTSSVNVKNKVTSDLDVTAAEGVVDVYPQAKCASVSASGDVSLEKGSTRQYATVTQLEGGSNSGYCLDS